MNTPETEQQPSLDLPSIQEGATTNDTVKQLGTERNTELLPTTPSNYPVKNSVTTNQQASSNDQDDQVVTTSAVTSSASSQNPAIADDIDLIEKEWVEKAKEIVEKTKDNPYLQNKAMSEFKADYIKKRYSKDLIVSEE